MFSNTFFTLKQDTINQVKDNKYRTVYLYAFFIQGHIKNIT